MTIPEPDSILEPLATRDRLIATAADMLMQQSYGAVSVDDICKAAEIKKGTFYHYFPSKTDLALAAYTWKWSMFEAVLDKCFQRDVAPLERLNRYASAAYTYQRYNFEVEGKLCGCPHTSAAQEMGTQDERIREKIKGIYDLHAAYFDGCLGDMAEHAAQTPERRRELAGEMLSFSSGVMCQAKVMNDPEVIRQQMLAGLYRLAGAAQTPPAVEFDKTIWINEASQCGVKIDG
ncbi:MAG TPA: TetR/AcrR family transcriptional regulator [Alphaproteobacteria bacterium]|nr:TetR/AcrR family transcriptional regulator [Alphaproteobacteria bacterium]